MLKKIFILMTALIMAVSCIPYSFAEGAEETDPTVSGPLQQAAFDAPAETEEPAGGSMPADEQDVSPETEAPEQPAVSRGVSAAEPVTLVITGQPETAYGDIGDTFSFTVSAQGEGLTYQWKYRTKGTGAWNSTDISGCKTATVTATINSNRLNTEYSCVVTDKYGNKVQSNPVGIVQRIVGLEITEQPQSVYGAIGDTFRFTVKAEGSGLKYQWKYRTKGTSTWYSTNISGYNTASVTAAVTSVRLKSEYCCVITDSKGGKITSDAVCILDYPALQITAQPGSRSAEEGGQATFSVTAAGRNITYQWQTKAAGASAWTDTAVTAASMTLSSLTLDKNGMQVRCIVKDSTGAQLTSNAATLTVTAPVTELKILTQPQDASAETGEQVSFSVTAQGDSVTYLWQTKAAGASAWTDTAVTAASMTLSSLTLDKNGMQARCIVKDSHGAQVTSTAATLTVTEVSGTELKILTQPQDASAETGEQVSFSVTAQGDSVTYLWQTKAAGASAWTDTAVTAASMTLSALTLDKNGMQARCIVKDSHGAQVTSTAATLTVTEAPGSSLRIITQPVPFTGDIGDTFSFTVEAAGEGLTYQWKYRTKGSTSWRITSLGSAKTATLTGSVTSARLNYEYSCVIKDEHGETLQSNAVCIEQHIIELRIQTPPQNATGNIGDSFSFTVGAQGTGLTYQWKYRTKGSDSWSNTSLSGAKTATLTGSVTSTRLKYEYCCEIKDKHGETLQSNAVCVQLPVIELKILTQPQNISGDIDDPFSFTVHVQGTGLKYQWKYHKKGSTSWSNTSLSGAKTSTLTGSVTSARLNYEYCCVITDSSGNKVTSNPVCILKKIPLIITAQPEDSSAEECGQAVFSVTAEGEGLTYLWQTKAAGTSAWADTAVTAASMTLSSLTLDKNGMQVRCIVKDSHGGQLTSAAATLTVTAPVTELKILTQPQDASAEAGEQVSFSVTAQGDSVTYLWQTKAAGASAWTDTAVTAASMTLSSLTADKNGTQVRCIVKDSHGGQLTSAAATLTVEPPDNSLRIITQPVPFTGDIGDTFSFTVEARGEGLTYQWKYRNKGTTAWSSTDISGCRTATVTAAVTSTRLKVEYCCVIKDSHGATVQSDPVYIIRPVIELKILTQPRNASGDINDPFSFTVEAQGTGLKYQWKYRTKGAASWQNSSMSGATAATLSGSITDSRLNYEFCCEITDCNGSKVTTDTVSIIRQIVELKILTQPQNAYGNTGDTFRFTVEAEGSGLKYQWKFRTKGNTSWSNTTISGATTASATATVTTTRLNSEYCCVITDSRGNKVTTDAVCILPKIDLSITAQPENTEGNEGRSASFTVTAAGIEVTYLWQTKAPGSGTWEDTAETSATLVLTCLTPGMEGTQVRCVLSDYFGATVTSSAATLTVLPPPTELKILTQPQSVICETGDTVTLTAEAQGDDLVYQWKYSLPGGTDLISSADSGANTASVTISVTSQNTGASYCCVITDKYGSSVTSDAAVLRERIPLRITSQPADARAAEGGNAVFSIRADGLDVTYCWQVLAGGEWANAGSDSSELTVPVNAETVQSSYRCVLTDCENSRLVSGTAGIALIRYGLTGTCTGYGEITLSVTGYTGDVARVQIRECTDDGDVTVKESASAEGIVLTDVVLGDHTWYAVVTCEGDEKGCSSDAQVRCTMKEAGGILYTLNTEGSLTVTGNTGVSGDLNIPSEADGFSVTAIGDSAFAGAAIQKAYIPSGISAIADTAFSGSTIGLVYTDDNAYADDWFDSHGYEVWYDITAASPYLKDGIIVLPRTTKTGTVITLSLICPKEWTLTATNAPGTGDWLNMTSPASGTGNAQISFTVTAVPGNDTNIDTRDTYATALMFTGRHGEELPLVIMLTKDASFANDHINTGNFLEDVIAIAETQLGFQSSNVRADYDGILDPGSKPGDCNKYALFMNINGNAWCASFVSWCCYQAGVPSSIISLNTYANPGKISPLAYNGKVPVYYMMTLNDKQSQDNRYLTKYGIKIDHEECNPQRGDLIFFRKANSPSDVTFSHIGIVLGNDDGVITYIDGNGRDANGEHTDSVHLNTILWNDHFIEAYFTPW
ncbi:MAG: hypothetical protein CW338_01760 [Clostridiales bacterium]|nr:hypothetical protein [Clostridiales bacterium]